MSSAYYGGSRRNSDGRQDVRSRLFFSMLLALVIIPAVCGLMPVFRMTTARIDIHVAFAVFLALVAPGISGALCAFALGWLADLFTGIPSGIVLCATMSSFVAARFLTLSMRDRSWSSFVIISALMDLFYGVLCRFLAFLGGLPSAPSAMGIFLSALSLIPASALLYPLLDAADNRTSRGRRR